MIQGNETRMKFDSIQIVLNVSTFLELDIGWKSLCKYLLNYWSKPNSLLNVNSFTASGDSG